MPLPPRSSVTESSPGAGEKANAREANVTRTSWALNTKTRTVRVEIDLPLWYDGAGG
jgi:hypothetical protein